MLFVVTFTSFAYERYGICMALASLGEVFAGFSPGFLWQRSEKTRRKPTFYGG